MNIKSTTNQTLPWYDHTTLDAMCTCPRYGLITYRHNKYLSYKPNDNLIAGTACHNFFAAYNAYSNGALLTKLFSEDTLEYMHSAAEASRDDSHRTAFALEALYASELPDDNSKKKSPEKLEKACIYWADRQNHGLEIVDVEVKFDITLDNHRYVGVIDCIQRSSRGKLIPVEYKTAARIDDLYIAKYKTNPQIVGYHVALKALYGEDAVEDYVILEALQVPQTKSEKLLPHLRTQYQMTNSKISDFLNWVKYNVNNVAKFSNNPYDAEMRPNACYRFNSVCSLLEFCDLELEDRKEIFNSEMETHIWDPTKEQA